MKREDSWNPLLDRRDVLRIGAVGAAGLAGFGFAGKAMGQCVTNPSETEGPFWVDEMLNRSDIRSDPTTGQLQAGVPLRLAINVSEIQAGSCSPVAGAYVDIWHCNALGAYSDEPVGMGNPNTLGQRWLRGYQVSDAHGNVRFLTIYPGWYMGRTVHVHFRIRKFSGSTVTFNFTSQMYFDDAVSNAIYASTAPYSTHTGRNPASNGQDNLYNSALSLRMSRNASHVIAGFDAVINSVPGLGFMNLTPTDVDSLEHVHDFGGGSPPFAFT
ncbi:MAG: intradiol ring-cleavage dioxygenase [Planctomycetes bacterium]|nr:intradiol ring-cleavage dioxygenase [Planctomycetota bacterium]MBI3833912.1 intradiol ring-cleavage dioxygenase [Planctomycetota bacterium]